MDREIITTEDGSTTLYIPELNEHYHSIHGAIQESIHIFIKAGIEYYGQKNIRVLEAGFGTGLNAFLTLLEARDNERKVVLFHYPIEEWNGFYVGSYHLHGHIHNTTVTHIDRRYNVSVDVINYTPVTLDELIAQNDVK